MIDPATVGVARDACLAAVGVVCMLTDLRERKIRNEWTFGGMGAGLGLALAARGGAGALDSLEGVGVCFALFYWVYAVGGAGAGDVKLLMAFGALGGFDFGFQTFLVGCSFLFLQSLVQVARGSLERGGLVAYLSWIQAQRLAGTPLEARDPLTKAVWGPPIILGALVARLYPWAPWRS